MVLGLLIAGGALAGMIGLYRYERRGEDGPARAPAPEAPRYEPSGTGVPWRTVFAVAAIVVLIWMAVPAFAGYHLGYNDATDHQCLTRVGVQWCK